VTLQNTVIEAGAGCGKTTQLTADIIKGLELGQFTIDRLVAITFTRDAAAELKQRIMSSLQKNAHSSELLGRALRDFGNSRITTIHSFCEGLLKQRPLEAGIDPAFTIIEDQDAEALRERVFSHWVRGLHGEALDNLNFVALEHGVPVFANPDSPFGKGSSLQDMMKIVLEHRELAFFDPPQPKPVDNIIERWKAACVDFEQRTDKEALLNFLQDFQDALSAAEPDVKSAINDLKKYKMGNKGGREDDVKSYRAEWASVCAPLLDELKYAACFDDIRPLYRAVGEVLGDLVRCYREEMRASGVMDFTEILIRTEELLRTDHSARDYFKQRFDYIMVDEFQDTDPLQADILLYLAEAVGPCAVSAHEIVLAEDKLYVVGDPKQSIFRFRRADIETYTRMVERIDASRAAAGGTAITRLNTNYRSCAGIVDWVNNMFADKMIRPENGPAYQCDYVPLTAHRTEPGAVRFVAPDNAGSDMKAEDARALEARLTACWIEENCAPTSSSGKHAYADVLALFRNRTNIEATADELEARGIPYKISGGRSFFGRQEILDVSNFLCALANPLDAVRQAATLKGPFFSISDAELYEWCQGGEKVRYLGFGHVVEDDTHVVAEALRQLNGLRIEYRDGRAFDAYQHILDETGVLVSARLGYRGPRTVGNLVKVGEFLRTLNHLSLADAAEGLRGRVENGAEMGDFAPSDEASSVRLMTIHGAKGLESPVVYFADVTSLIRPTAAAVVDNSTSTLICNVKSSLLAVHFDKSRLPCVQKLLKEDDCREAAEAMRLRYVAATRARDLLLINSIPYEPFRNGESFADAFYSMVSPALTDTVVVSDPPAQSTQGQPEASAPADEMLSELGELKDKWAAAKENASQETLKIVSPSKAPAAVTGDDAFSIDVQLNTAEMNFEVKPRDASTVGSIVHKLLELQPEDPEGAVALLLPPTSGSINVSAILERYNAIKADVDELVKDANQVLREVPIKFKDGDVYYDGIIDLLIEKDDGWMLVDFKIKSQLPDDPDALAAQYKSQLECYRKGLEQVGVKVNKALLLGS
jgi:ATP-dependent helicase/nuclease subunit A